MCASCHTNCVHRQPVAVVEESPSENSEDDDGVMNDEFEEAELQKQNLFEDDEDDDGGDVGNTDEFVDDEDDVSFKYKKAFSDENKKWLKPKKVAHRTLAPKQHAQSTVHQQSAILARTLCQRIQSITFSNARRSRSHARTCDSRTSASHKQKEDEDESEEEEDEDEESDEDSDEELDVERQAKKAEAAKRREAEMSKEEEEEMRKRADDEFAAETTLLVGKPEGDEEDTGFVTLPSGTQIKKDSILPSFFVFFLVRFFPPFSCVALFDFIALFFLLHNCALLRSLFWVSLLSFFSPLLPSLSTALLGNVDMSAVKLRIQGLLRTLANFADMHEEGKTRQEYVCL